MPNPNHAFAGVRSFVDTANASHTLPADLLAKAKALVPVSRACVALAQAITGPQTAAHQNACVAEADRWRKVLSLALDGVERAITDVCTAYSLTAPTFTANTDE
jgi:hypothetical protein